MPNTGGARYYLQLSVFLSGKCMARNVFACSAALRRSVVATVDALRSRSALHLRRLWSGVSLTTISLHSASKCVCCLASNALIYTLGSKRPAMRIYSLFYFICLFSLAVFFKSVFGVLGNSWLLALLILGVFLWPRFARVFMWCVLCISTCE